MKILRLTFLLILLTQISFGQSKKLKTEDVFKRYLVSGDESLAEVIIKSDDGLYSLFCKGELSKNSEEKIDLFTKFIDQNPKNGLDKAYLNRGIEYFQNEKMDSAISDFNKSIELNSKEPFTYYFRGASFASLEEYDKAILDYTKAIKLNPNFGLAYLMRGNSYFNQKKYEKAIDEYNMSIEIDENSDNTYIMRGIVYEAMGEYKKAISDWKKAKKINSDNSETVDKLIEKTTKKMNK